MGGRGRNSQIHLKVWNCAELPLTLACGGLIGQSKGCGGSPSSSTLWYLWVEREHKGGLRSCSVCFVVNLKCICERESHSLGSSLLQILFSRNTVVFQNGNLYLCGSGRCRLVEHCNLFWEGVTAAFWRGRWMVSGQRVQCCPAQLYWHRFSREEQKENNSSEVDVKGGGGMEMMQTRLSDAM